MTTSIKSSNVVAKYVLTALLIFFGTVGVVLAQGSPAVPAGTNPAPTATAAPAGAAAAPGAAPGASPAAPGIGGMLMPFLLMFAIVYFLMIRPQQKRMKTHQKMLGELKHGDDIVTSSGVLGKVTGIAEKVVTVEIAEDVRIKMLKSQVSQVVKGQVQELSQS